MLFRSAEHLGYQYRRQIEERLGVPLPPPDKPLPEDTEVQLSRLVAQASTQVLQINQQEAAQKQAQQQAQDPLIQMQQKELAIKEEEVKRKTIKDQADINLAEKKIALEAERISVEARKERDRLQAQRDKDATKVQTDIFKTLNKGGTK